MKNTIFTCRNLGVGRLLFTLAFCAFALCAHSLHAQTPAKNKAAVLKAYQDLSNKHDVTPWSNALPPLPDPLPYWPLRRGSLNSAFAQYFAAIPDAKFIVEGATAEGNTVTIELLSTGTLKNKFMDWEPSEKPFSFRSSQTLTFDSNGKITSGWPFPDPALYLR